jgi:pimeloyl-ACP methyl ester carboxylesterase
MAEVMVHVNGAPLCVETFGDPAAPAVLLIAGAAMSMDWWDADFGTRLAAGGRFVIRYDHRDTGRSISYPPGAPGYRTRDLFGDAVGLIDAVGHGHAHLVGLSMGGGIAQHIVRTRPAEVDSLTLLSTSPGTGDDLPPMADRLRAVFADPPPDPDWSDRDAVVDHLVAAQRPYAGPDSFDETYVREVVGQVVDRTVNVESATKNHWLVLGGGDDGAEETPPPLAEVTAPTLVIHGTEDPLFPPGHGMALAREIPGAELVLLDGVGHQVPPRSTWDLVVPAILRNTCR